MVVFNGIPPHFKGKPEIKVKIFSPNGTDEAWSYCSFQDVYPLEIFAKELDFSITISEK